MDEFTPRLTACRLQDTRAGHGIRNWRTGRLEDRRHHVLQADRVLERAGGRVEAIRILDDERYAGRTLVGIRIFAAGCGRPSCRHGRR